MGRLDRAVAFTRGPWATSLDEMFYCFRVAFKLDRMWFFLLPLEDGTSRISIKLSSIACTVVDMLVWFRVTSGQIHYQWTDASGFTVFLQGACRYKQLFIHMIFGFLGTFGVSLFVLFYVFLLGTQMLYPAEVKSLLTCLVTLSSNISKFLFSRDNLR